MLEHGVCADGTPYDEMAGMHQLAGEIQAEIMGVLNTVRKVPQTDAGTVQLVAAVGNACRAALRRGFLAPGIWTGDGVLTINTGDALTEGFAVLADSVDSQSREDRQKRLAPPIYALVKLSGAMEYAVINVTVDR